MYEVTFVLQNQRIRKGQRPLCHNIGDIYNRSTVSDYLYLQEGGHQGCKWIGVAEIEM